MPGFNGTGPRGQGPITGGGRGFCAVPLGRGRHLPYEGRFFGRGRGRGFRNRYRATGLPGWARVGYGYPAPVGVAYPYPEGLTSQEERDILKEEAQILEEQLADIQSRIDTLGKGQKQQEQK